MKKQYKNRFHASKWPNDPLKINALAKTDLGFVDIMKASGVETPELQAIAKTAQDRLDWLASKYGRHE